MSRRQKDPLRPFTETEQHLLLQCSRSQTAPAVEVIRAQILLRVAQGATYQDAAHAVGGRSGEAVATLVSRFNQEGMSALRPRHGGGLPRLDDQHAKERILREAARTPTVEQDGTATWSLTTLQQALRSAPDGLPQVSTYTLWNVLREAGQSSQQSRTFLRNGDGAPPTQGRRRARHRPGHPGEKKLIEDAYRLGESLGLSVWCHDQAGPFPTVPYTGKSWQPEGKAACQPHEYQREGTVKMLTLFHPADGHVRVQGTASCTNPILHGWLKKELTAIVQTLPVAPTPPDPVSLRAVWEGWQGGLTVKPTLLAQLPPLRMLLILDNLAGHKTPAFVCWLFAQGILPLYTPLGGSWLNMATEHPADLETAGACRAASDHP